MTSASATAKEAALEAYVTVLSGDGRRIRNLDHRGEDRGSLRDDRTHVRAAVDWLCRAHDMGDDGGVSAMFSLIEGWLGSYPETTGYIIPTLLDAADYLSDADLRSRAGEMADWLLTMQNHDGSFPGSFVGRLTGPRVFNTGQIVFGLVRIARQTGDRRFAEAAERAGRWLVNIQDGDGAWRRHTFNNIPHVYNVRTAWALAVLADHTGDDRFKTAAIANGKWAVANQRDSGWFEQNAFTAAAGVTNLHTIAYAMRGLLELGSACGCDDFIEASSRAASALQKSWRRDETLAGQYASDLSDGPEWRCITGEAQTAIVWLRLDQITGSPKFAEDAVSLLDRVKTAQLFDDTNPDLHGGVTGSVPINGSYERYCLINWGPKFLVDALLLKGRMNVHNTDG
jgi:Squalene-hopene cyclase C-terminal domain